MSTRRDVLKGGAAAAGLIAAPSLSFARPHRRGLGPCAP